jgi:RNA polymerase sigma-B factor
MSSLDDAVRRRYADPNGEEPDVLARFNAHRDLAARLARRYERSSNRTDLVQVADVGLLLAARRYDPSQGAFERFAVVTIIGELKKHLRRTGWNVRVPRRVQEDALAVQAAIDRLNVELGRSPRLSEVAEAAQLTLERVSQAMHAWSARFAASEVEPDRSWATSRSDDPCETLDVRAAVERLPPADRLLISFVFDDDLTQREVAGKLGVSQSQVQRRLARILRTLHGTVADQPNAAAQ